MNTHTADIQTILDEDGEPAFVVIPYHRYRELVEPRTALPHEVVGMVINKGYSLIKAWRTYLRLTQKDIARALGISQSAVSQIESVDGSPRGSTLQKLANVFNVDPELLADSAEPRQPLSR